MTPRQGILITLLGVMVITPDSLLVRIAATDGFNIAFFRGLFSALSIFAFLLLKNSQQVWIDLKNYRGFDALGSLIYCASGFTFVYAINNAIAANVLLMFSIAPFFALLLSYFFLKERIEPALVVTIIISFVGVAVIASGYDMGVSKSYGERHVLGMVAALVASFTFAASVTIARSQRRGNVLLNFAVASAMLAALTVFKTNFGILSSWQYLWLFLMGGVSIPLSYCLILYAARGIHSAMGTLIITFEVIMAPIILWWVIGEYPGERTFYGSVIILGAVGFLCFKKMRES